MIRVDSSAVMLSGPARTEYMRALPETCKLMRLFVRQAGGQGLQVSDELFVPLGDGRGRLIVELSVGGSPIVTFFHPVAAGDWMWVLGSRGGSA